MRAVVQRVTRARIRVDAETVGEIGKGLVVMLGVARDDTDKDAEYLANKIAALRVFDDLEGRMNLSVVDAGGELMVVSQFTLYGDVRRGSRPSWIEAAGPEVAEPLYELFVRRAKAHVGQVATGRFRSMMQIELINDGPVTILVDSRKSF
jgi:D-tyrosyl-tRNA(Tyr) deacylase